MLETYNSERHYRRISLRQAKAKGYVITCEYLSNPLALEPQELLDIAKSELKAQRKEFLESIAEAEASLETVKEEVGRAKGAVEPAELKKTEQAENEQTDPETETWLETAKEAAAKAEKNQQGSLQKMLISQWYSMNTSDCNYNFLRHCYPIHARDS